MDTSSKVGGGEDAEVSPADVYSKKPLSLIKTLELQQNFLFLQWSKNDWDIMEKDWGKGNDSTLHKSLLLHLLLRQFQLSILLFLIIIIIVNCYYYGYILIVDVWMSLMSCLHPSKFFFPWLLWWTRILEGLVAFIFEAFLGFFLLFFFIFMKLDKSSNTDRYPFFPYLCLRICNFSSLTICKVLFMWLYAAKKNIFHRKKTLLISDGNVRC